MADLQRSAATAGVGYIGAGAAAAGCAAATAACSKESARECVCGMREAESLRGVFSRHMRDHFYRLVYRLALAKEAGSPS